MHGTNITYFFTHNGSTLCSGKLLRLGEKAVMFLHNGAQIPGTGSPERPNFTCLRLIFSA